MIGILNANYFAKDSEAQQAQYKTMLLGFLKEFFPEREIRFYEVHLGQLPQSTNECSRWILPGSTKSAFDSDPWILKLNDFIINCIYYFKWKKQVFYHSNMIIFLFYFSHF